MTMKPFKFIVQPVVLVLDEEDCPVDERTSDQPVVLYGTKSLREWVENFERSLEEENSR